jgi:3D (Asp-Asp-Asp) domain-containing protein
MIRARLTAFVLAHLIAFGGVGIGQAIEQAERVQEETDLSMEYAGDYRVTAYAYYEGGEENYYTASGATPVPYYTVATGDEFSFGTVLYIEGIGYVEVQDRGGFGEGIIDLHIGWDSMDSFEDRTRAVYIVQGE